MRFGEAGGQVRALPGTSSRWCGRVWAWDELRGTGNSVLRVVMYRGGAGSRGIESQRTWSGRAGHGTGSRESVNVGCDHTEEKKIEVGSLCSGPNVGVELFGRGGEGG